MLEPLYADLKETYALDTETPTNVQSIQQRYSPSAILLCALVGVPAKNVLTPHTDLYQCHILSHEQ